MIRIIKYNLIIRKQVSNVLAVLKDEFIEKNILTQDYQARCTVLKF